MLKAKFEKITPQDQEEFENAVLQEQDKRLQQMFDKLKAHKVAIPKELKPDVEELAGERFFDEPKEPESKLLDEQMEEEVFRKGGLSNKFKQRNLPLNQIIKQGAAKHKKWAELQKQRLKLEDANVPYNPDDFELEDDGVNDDKEANFNDADFEQEDYEESMEKQLEHLRREIPEEADLTTEQKKKGMKYHEKLLQMMNEDE